MLFEAAGKFRRLHLVDALGLLPRNELVMMKMAQEFEERGEPPGVSDLARRMRISAPAASRTLRRLREKQYVECTVDDDDRRNTCVAVTPVGRAALGENMRKVTDFLDRALSHLSDEDLEQYFFLFDKIYEGVRAELVKMEAGTADYQQKTTEGKDRNQCFGY